MKPCAQSPSFYNYRKRRRNALLRRMAAMRAAKERKRLERAAPEHSPRLTRWHPLELGLRDKTSGDVAWVEFKSLRDAMRRLAVVQNWYINKTEF